MTTISNGTDTSTPILIEGYESIRATRNITHSILGTNVPAVSLRTASLRTGTLTALVANRAAAVILEGILAGDDVLTFADPDEPTLDMTFTTDRGIRVILDPTTRKQWHVTFTFNEVAP